MKYIGVISNQDKDIDLSITKQVVNYILSKGCFPVLSEHTAASINMLKYAANTTEDIYKLSDFIIVLGGDGTLLGVGRNSAIYNTPILGINLGTLGFLTDVEVSGASESIDKVLSGDYKIEKRMMLEASFYSKGVLKDSYLALNDVCITRGVFSKIVDLSVFINQEFLDTYRADGIIISTPTGSTAYNLSAGGPILKPDSEIVAITPICPHALNARSIVISAEDVVTVEVYKKSRGDLLISMDGQTGTSLSSNDIVRIKRSKYYTSIIKTNYLGFYDILRRKLVMKGES